MSTVSHVPIFNPADRTKTTIREMTEGKLDNNHLNINNQTDISGATKQASSNLCTYNVTLPTYKILEMLVPY